MGWIRANSQGRFAQVEPRSGWLPAYQHKLAVASPTTASATEEPSSQVAPAADVAKSSIWLWAFPIALALPTEMSLNLGGLRLTPYRLALLGMFVPAALQCLQGTGVRRSPADLWVTGFALWAALCLAVRNGIGEAIESGGILVAESLGAYLLARVAVRTTEDLRKFLGAMTVVLLLLFAVALPETLSGQHLTHDIFGAILGNRPSTEVEGRFGLGRAYASFDHPILFGTFAGMWLSLLWDARQSENIFKRAARGALVVGTTFCSLSSGCLMALFLQGGLLFYRRATSWLPGRWLLLVATIFTAYNAVSAASSRSGLKVLLWYLTFDRHTASYRIGIWEHATDDVARHPLFGVGMENWERPDWMAQSVDSFWLVMAMSYGLPAVAFLLLAVMSQARGVVKASAKGHSDTSLRLSWVFSVTALCLVGFTVHFWNNVFCAFFFILGTGAALSGGGRSRLNA